MTTSPATRRPPTAPKATAAPAGQQIEPLQLLPPATSSWPRGALALAGAALAGFALAPAFGYGATGPAILAAGLLAAAAVTVAGVRSGQRRQLLDSLTIALGPILGWRPPQRASVRAFRWAKGWVGRPAKLRIRYSPLVDYTDPSWRPTLLAVAERCFLKPYEVTKHQPRKQRITLTVITALKEAAAAVSAKFLRAQRTVTELLGPTAQVTPHWDGEDLVALDVMHEAGTKVAAPGMRARVERTLSTMLEGRWRARWDIENDRVRFEIRPSLPSSVRHPVPEVTDDNRMQLPYGVDEDGNTLCWDMRSSASSPHQIVVGKTGSGKASAIVTPVPTPSGWTTMGELRDGDVVFDETGQPCTVVTAHPIRYDRPCYEMVFSDGSTIVCDAEHLWWTESRNDRQSRFNRDFKHRHRATPRDQRLPESVQEHLRTVLEAAAATDQLSVPELARLAALSESHPVLQKIAAAVGPSGTRERGIGAFAYAEQVVRQRQKVTVYDRLQVLEHLSAKATAAGWRHGITVLSLRDLAEGSSAEAEITTPEVAALLEGSRRIVRPLLQTLPSRVEHRVVELKVPARTVHRRLPGNPVVTYPARAMIEALLEWGGGLHKDRHEPHPGGAVRTTTEILATLRDASGYANHSIPLAKAVQYPPAEQPIPPYVLGVWLGDGTVWGAEVTSADPEILDHVQAEGMRVTDRGRPKTSPDTYQSRLYTLHGLRGPLNELGLLRCSDLARRSRTKHIPQQYLVASDAQRRALLAGLLDTDGTVARQGTVQFDNTNETLAGQVHELVCSLGYRATITESRATLYGRDCGPKWKVSFTTTDDVFRLERKRVVLQERTRRYNPEKNRVRYVVDVRPVASVPVRCITVDSPSRLYLVGKSFIPTHNTVLINGLAMEAAYRGWPVWLNDPKRIEFLGLRGWPNVQIVATTIPDQIAVIYKAWEEMERRYEAIELGESVESDFEPLIFVLDEYRDFHGGVTDWYAGVKVPGMPARCPVFEKVSSIARKGRSARIHLVLGTQRPDAEFLTGEALALDTPIPTPEGWTTMGELEPGQEVIGDDGRPVLVTAVTEVAFDRPCYRLTFSDGSTLVADADHLWPASSVIQRSGDSSLKVNLTRSERWPAHVALGARLAEVARQEVDGAREVTVSEFEQVVGQGRLTLLRRGINTGRLGLRPSAGGAPSVGGRYSGRRYRLGDVMTALTEEVNSPAPSWRSTTRIVTTREMADALTCNKTSNWSIHVAAPLDLPTAELPVDPWLLGYWLGDGHKASATIATADQEVLARIRSLGYRVTHYARFNYGVAINRRGGMKKPCLVDGLRQLGVLGNKHIPMSYLRASAAQRGALLAGLLDSDGTCTVRQTGKVASGKVMFFNVDRGLIDGVAELAASLGFVPTVRLARPGGVENCRSSVAYGSPLRPAWVVAFTPDRQVFGIGRKQRALAPSLAFTRRVTTRRRYVISVEPVPSVPVRCIAVDAPNSLFLAGKSFIPTHNCRDNFDSRVSLGRLSPQGAMMMWETAYTGVAIPKRIPGRGTGVSYAGDPVEMQTFWTPDPRRAAYDGNAEDLALLERLKPAVVSHEPLRVQYDERVMEEVNAKDQPIGVWRAVISAELVPVDGSDTDGEAATRLVEGAPDAALLDQTSEAAGSVPAASATMNEAVSPAPAAPGLRLVRPSAGEDEDEAQDEEEFRGATGSEMDEFEGYGPAQEIRAGRLRAGDLVLVDEGSQMWAAIESAEPDLDDGYMCIDWRGDDGEEGSLSLADEDLVTSRRVLEELG